MLFPGSMELLKHTRKEAIRRSGRYSIRFRFKRLENNKLIIKKGEKASFNNLGFSVDQSESVFGRRISIADLIIQISSNDKNF